MLYDGLVEPRPPLYSVSTVQSRMEWPTDLRSDSNACNALEGLDDYHLLHAARADMLRRVGQLTEAKAAYGTALQLTENTPNASTSSAASANATRRPQPDRAACRLM